MEKIFKGTHGVLNAKGIHVIGNKNVPIGQAFIGNFKEIKGRLQPDDQGEIYAKLFAAAPDMLEAMIEFCDRVDKGEVRSKKTYAKFKEIIKKATE